MGYHLPRSHSPVLRWIARNFAFFRNLQYRTHSVSARTREFKSVLPKACNVEFHIAQPHGTMAEGVKVSPSAFFTFCFYIGNMIKDNLNKKCPPLQNWNEEIISSTIMSL